MSAGEEAEQHQGVVLLLHVQLQVEQVAGLNLGGATGGTLQVCFLTNLVEILDFKSLGEKKGSATVTAETGVTAATRDELRTNQTPVVDLLEHDVQDEEEDLIGVVLCVTCQNTPC